MNDGAYLFRQTEIERKRSGRGAFSKKNGSRSKKCSLPSDRLTARQRKELNGKLETYNLNKPMTWTEFLGIPYDLQAKYLDGLVKNYSARRNDIALMFGIQPNTLSSYISKKLGGKKYWDGASPHNASYEWLHFVASADFKVEEVSQPVEECSVQPAPSESVKHPVAEDVPTKLVPIDLEVTSGHVVFRGEPHAIFTKALMALDTSKTYKVEIYFTKEE